MRKPFFKIFFYSLFTLLFISLLSLNCDLKSLLKTKTPKNSKPSVTSTNKTSENESQQNKPFVPTYSPIPVQIVKSGPSKLKMVSITIDDGWNADNRILDLMKQYNIKCTVFVIGGRGVAEDNPDWIKKMDKMGFEVCTHTYSHYILAKKDNDWIANDLRKGQEVISRITHKQFHYMRPSGGYLNDRVEKVIADNGYIIILWSSTLNDTSGNFPPSKMASGVLKNLKNGDIIICHFGGNHTYEALSILVPEIVLRGFEITTITQLLKAKEELDFNFSLR